MGKYDRARNWLEMEAAQDITLPPKEDESWTDKLASQLGVLGVSPTEALQQGWKQGGQMSGRAGPFITLSTTGREIEKRDKKKDDQPFFPRSPRPPRFDDDDDDDEQTQIINPPKEPWQMTREEFETKMPPVEGYAFHGSSTQGIETLKASYGMKGLSQGSGVFAGSRETASMYGHPGGSGQLYYVRNNPEKVLDMDELMDRDLWERINEKVIEAQESADFSEVNQWLKDVGFGPSEYDSTLERALDDLESLQKYSQYHSKSAPTHGQAYNHILYLSGDGHRQNLSSDVIVQALIDEGYDATLFSFDDAAMHGGGRRMRNPDSDLITVFLTDQPVVSEGEVWRAAIEQAIAEGRDVPPEVLEEYNSIYVWDGPR